MGWLLFIGGSVAFIVAALLDEPDMGLAALGLVLSGIIVGDRSAM